MVAMGASFSPRLKMVVMGASFSPRLEMAVAKSSLRRKVGPMDVMGDRVVTAAMVGTARGHNDAKASAVIEH